MATAPKLDVEVLHPATDIMLVVEESPQIVLLEPEKFDQFYARVKAETETLVVDLSTKRGRDEIRSMAAKVVRSKTLIDKARLQLTGQWREQTSQVNAAGKEIEQRLVALADDVRRPLTEWEEAEKARVAGCRADIEGFQRAAVVTMDDTATTVRERGAEVWGQALDPERFGDMLPEAQAAKETAVATLKAALARLIQEEADRAELEKLRAEAAEREERERMAAEEAARVEAAKERERRDAAEAAAAEERRVAAAQAEAERIEQARQEAVEQAEREAETRARDERDRVNREHDEALAAERRRAEAAERAERDRVAQAEAEAAEQARRDKNRAHRGKVMSEVKAALMTCGADEETAKKIVLAIIAGEVPAVTLRF